jgi:hypothetical protein
MAGALAALLAALIAPAPLPARDRGADGDFRERSSSHFLLEQDVAIERYSGPRGSRAFELQVLEVLEAAHDRVAQALGIRARDRFRVRIYDAEIFDASFNRLFKFRAAGFFNGVIHVRGHTSIDERLLRTLHHEYVHAALEAAGGAVLFPGWLNEGLAEYFEHPAIGTRTLLPGEAERLIAEVRAGRWIPLRSLSAPSFSGMPGDAALLAYLESYAFVAHLSLRHGERSLADLLDRAWRSGDFERAFERTYRGSVEELEAELVRSLR